MNKNTIVASGYYNVTCQRFAEHEYEQRVPAWGIQFAVCGACGAAAKFEPRRDPAVENAADYLGEVVQTD